MSKRILGVAIVLLTMLLLAGCFADVNPQEVADIVSKTQTAMALQAAPPAAAADTEAPPPTETQPPGPPEPPDRCALFDPAQNTFVIHTIEWGDESFVMYVKLPGDVPGLVKPVEGDDAPWIYEATIGGLESLGCKTYEGDIYRNRIYCVFPIDQTYYNTAQPFEMRVNGCDTPIAGHPRLSLVVPEPEEEAASSEPASCSAPSPFVCGAAFEDYCNCLGMDYYCHNLGWGITFPACYPPSP
jgi:hypothetical protein